MKLLCSVLLFAIFGFYSCGYAQSKKTFVIVHGAYGGRHNFKGIDSILKSKQKKVYRPSLTGLGERVHLSSPNIGLQTHILDVVNTILYEDLKNIVLVGHSYGGMIIPGVADSLPNRINKIVYLDAVIPDSGESLISLHGDEAEEAEKFYKANLKGGLIYLDSENFKKKYPPKDEGQPYKTFTDTIVYNHNVVEKIPTSFIDCGAEPFAKKAKNKGWPVYKLGEVHNVQWSDPEGLSDLLIKISEQ